MQKLIIFIFLVITLTLAGCGNKLANEISEQVETAVLDDELAVDESKDVVKIEVTNDAKSEIAEILAEEENVGKLPRIYISGYA